MKIPVYLKHKPVIVAENYEEIDGKWANNSEAKGLSLGLAQWNDRGRVDISAKVWRHTGGKWSRQSEELPLHRVMDLAILICRALVYFQNHTEDACSEQAEIDRIPLQGSAMQVAFCRENPLIDEDIPLFFQTLQKDRALLQDRLSTLSKLLKEMGN